MKLDVLLSKPDGQVGKTFYNWSRIRHQWWAWCIWAHSTSLLSAHFLLLLLLDSNKSILSNWVQNMNTLDSFQHRNHQMQPEQNRNKQLMVINLGFTCMFTSSFWLDGRRERMEKWTCACLNEIETGFTIKAKLHFCTCLASAALPSRLSSAQQESSFPSFADSFFRLLSSERFHTSAHCCALREHQRCNAAAQQRSFCGLQGQSE